MSSRYLIPILLALGVVLGAGPRPPAGTPPPEGAVAVERVPVKTVAVQKRDLEVTMPVFGSISYLDKVEVASEVPGVLKEVPVQPGDLVRQGQVLARMDTDLLQTELQAKAAQKAQAEAQLKFAAWEHQAQRQVFKVGGISRKDFEEVEARYHARQADTARAAAELAHVQTQMKKAAIAAPITGIVGQKNFNAGERVPPQSDKGVVTLMQIDEVYAEGEVNERDLARLRPGLEVIALPDAYPRMALRGRIERLEPVLKPESRSVIAKVRLPNPELLLRPGMFARLEIVLDKVPGVVAVPSAALRPAPDKSWMVFVIADEVAFARKVKPGLATPAWTEITEGLEPGEAVVVEGAERLRDLSRVVSSSVSP